MQMAKLMDSDTQALGKYPFPKQYGIFAQYSPTFRPISLFDGDIKTHGFWVKIFHFDEFR